MKYKNETCTICLKKFSAEDDVVVCPDCGSPFHRECYKEAEKCPNLDKHGKFIWEATQIKLPEEKISEQKKEIIPQRLSQNQIPENGVIGEILVDKDGNQRPSYRAIRGNEKIGNTRVKNYGEVVQVNKHKYIPRFMMFDKTNRKISWNWAAFFFGPYWFAFRKMWKYAILAMIISSIIPISFMNEITEYYEEAWKVYSEVLMSDSLSSETDFKEMQDKLLKEMPTEPRSMSAASYIDFAIKIIAGLYGNYLYMKKCEHVMEAAKKKGKTEEVQKKFIEKKGGRSIAHVVLFTFVQYGFLVVCMAIMMALGTDLATELRRFI
ncbi:MAG: DUF2628 domain-containing protein [Ruminococcaceae bacterium]|nr:DUF2628 domain-containing protein [Oscillospiraceae bacterium]